MRRSTVLAILCVLAVASCSVPPSKYDGDDALREVAKGKDASFLKCKDVWKVGETLPAEYTYGCLNGGSVVVESYIECQDGKSRLFVHRGKAGMDTEVAISGSEIFAYSKDAKKAALKTCLG